MTLRGATGDIRWAYMVAATFGPWRLEYDGESGTLEGSIVQVDDYRLNKQPLEAVLVIGRKSVRYPVVTLECSGRVLTAKIGPRIREMQ